MSSSVTIATKSLDEDGLDNEYETALTSPDTTGYEPPFAFQVLVAHCFVAIFPEFGFC